MKKNQYIAPELTIVSTICHSAILVISGTNLNSNAPEKGGEYTNSSGVTVGVKGQNNYDVWNDDWSK